MNLSKPFQVTGYSLQGRVVDAHRSVGVMDVVIKVNGSEKAKTDANGYENDSFPLDAMRSS